MMDIRDRLFEISNLTMRGGNYSHVIDKVTAEVGNLKRRIAELEKENEKLFDIAKRKTERIEELRTNLVAMMMNQTEVTEVINKMQDTFTETLKVFSEIENES
jgi:predicted nuclease with TOPRIM domain